MLELIAEIVGYFSSIALDIQEFFFRKKREKRRRFEEENNLPKKKMRSPYDRTNILFVVVLIIVFVLGVFGFPRFNVTSKNSERVKKIKELLEKEKKVFGTYPEKLQSIKRGDPLRKNLLIDDWGTTFKYSIVEDSYLLISAGKDKKFETEDDIQFN
ncbi:hypothetical protein [Tenacibaculum sp. 190524A05c]|uniref:hypothetical protein n=1 Tax=Tenacibaculum platacis TaxID=3137852 RepID=UPI0032B1F749